MLFMLLVSLLKLRYEVLYLKNILPKVLTREFNLYIPQIEFISRENKNCLFIFK